ncbi:MAG TPA: Stp1/IreP family PP2C-type Ser/Thr phosphatase [Bryobacteraceae bacterium]|jgi:serine/threonine protein phosphatase PrpC|nr:Stp1/IreP family PP2C-type Ser/Thr phosphatase [Bryobacteraceae bacterium]
MKLRLRWGSRTPDAKPDSSPQPLPPPEPEPEPPPSDTLPAIEALPPSEPGIIGKLMIEAYGASNVGCVRTNNEDYFLVAPTIGLYVVADGMGGAQAGEHASKLAVETVFELIQKLDPSVADSDTVSDALVNSFEEANRRVMDAASSDPDLEGMGTTLIAAMQSDQGVIVASVGDSRVYVFENDKLKLVTEDQTWVNEVGRRLGIEEESLKTHPMRHVLTMAIGVSEQLRVHTYELHLAPGSQVLLCSDGLHGVAPEDEIANILHSKDSLESKCEQLIASARAHGGPDNVTAVLLQAV